MGWRYFLVYSGEASFDVSNRTPAFIPIFRTLATLFASATEDTKSAENQERLDRLEPLCVLCALCDLFRGCDTCYYLRRIVMQ